MSGRDSHPPCPRSCGSYCGRSAPARCMPATDPMLPHLGPRNPLATRPNAHRVPQAVERSFPGLLSWITVGKRARRYWQQAHRLTLRVDKPGTRPHGYEHLRSALISHITPVLGPTGFMPRRGSSLSISKRPQDVLSLYTGACAGCSDARSCSACLKTAYCSSCTEAARCGSCRNVHSKFHRSSGRQASVRSARTTVHYIVVSRYISAPAVEHSRSTHSRDLQSPRRLACLFKGAKAQRLEKQLGVQNRTLSLRTLNLMPLLRRVRNVLCGERIQKLGD